MPNMQNLVQNRSNLPAPIAPRVNFVAALAFIAPVALGGLSTLITLNPVGAILGVLLGFLLAQSPKIARQWERAVVLRLGRVTAAAAAGAHAARGIEGIVEGRHGCAHSFGANAVPASPPSI